MAFRLCGSVKIYAIIIVVILILACIINMFVDYFNNIGIVSTLIKNTVGTLCGCFSCLIVVIILGFICSYPVGNLIVWALVILVLLCSSSAVMGNFFYVYSYNPVILV